METLKVNNLELVSPLSGEVAGVWYVRTGEITGPKMEFYNTDGTNTLNIAVSDFGSAIVLSYEGGAEASITANEAGSGVILSEEEGVGASITALEAGSAVILVVEGGVEVRMTALETGGGVSVKDPLGDTSALLVVEGQAYVITQDASGNITILD